MNSNLVPTPRTDKTGKTVIRHMRPVKTSIASSIPAPSMQEAIDRSKELLEEPSNPAARERLKEILFADPDQKKSGNVWSAWIDNMPEEIVVSGLATLEKYPGHGRVLKSVRRSFQTWHKKNVRLTLEHLAFAAANSHLSSEGQPDVQVQNACILFIVPNRQWDYELTDQELEQAAAVAHAAIATDIWCKDNNPRGYRGARSQYIEDYPEMMRVVVENYEKEPQMTEFIKMRGTDAGLLREFLSVDVAPLSDGIL